jgi:hypothetical protein
MQVYKFFVFMIFVISGLVQFLYEVALQWLSEYIPKLPEDAGFSWN